MNADWIAVDWGTTHLRAWAIAADGRVLSEAHSNDGMGGLSRDRFEPALLALIAGWLPAMGSVPVIACGMVGARQGWSEAPYRIVPCPPVGPGLHDIATADGRIRVRVVPGLSQQDPADVMRGEETQIAGLISRDPGFAGTVLLPGTHSKWVRVAAGSVVSFTTFLTGELFALLADRSILRHDCAGEDLDASAFDRAAALALADPASVPARLFSIRATGLLRGNTSGVARATLSGLLIGQEVAAARALRGVEPVRLIGAGALCALYARALGLDGVAVRVEDGAGLTLAGLIAARSGQEG